MPILNWVDSVFYLCPVRVYISTGSNMGNRELMLKTAAQKLNEQAGTVMRESSIIETRAWGKTEQPNFLNQVLELQTAMQPEELMQTLLQIEREMGRVREEKWGPRLIDLDILLFEDLIYSSDTLQIPHPFLHERLFVLKPLFELAPDLMHPELKLTVGQLLEKLEA
jgi:2-amino-4-hydroxy-6-hydroxymethyldihydropteridine diphosphokinase